MPNGDPGIINVRFAAQPAVRRTIVGVMGQLRSKRLTDHEVQEFRRVATRWVGRLWFGGVFLVFAALVASGATERLVGSHLPPPVAAAALLCQVVGFPGLQAAAFVAWKAGFIAHLEHLGSACFWATGIGVLSAGVALTGVFWGIAVPWVITAARVYVWPRPFVRGE